MAEFTVVLEGLGFVNVEADNEHAAIQQASVALKAEPGDVLVVCETAALRRYEVKDYVFALIESEER